MTKTAGTPAAPTRVIVITDPANYLACQNSLRISLSPRKFLLPKIFLSNILDLESHHSPFKKPELLLSLCRSLPSLCVGCACPYFRQLPTLRSRYFQYLSASSPLLLVSHSTRSRIAPTTCRTALVSLPHSPNLVFLSTGISVRTV